MNIERKEEIETLFGPSVDLFFIRDRKHLLVCQERLTSKYEIVGDSLYVYMKTPVFIKETVTC